MERHELTKAHVEALLDYNPETGFFTWKKTRGCTAWKGSLAGGACPDGYWRLKVHRRTYMAHRLAWLVTHGEWPAEQIDHIDRNKSNNAIANLRAANQAQNAQNFTFKKLPLSGVPGVILEKRGKKYRPFIRANGVLHWLGRYDDLKEAEAVRIEAKKRLHPFNPHQEKRTA